MNYNYYLENGKRMVCNHIETKPVCTGKASDRHYYCRLEDLCLDIHPQIDIFFVILKDT